MKILLLALTVSLAFNALAQMDTLSSAVYSWSKIKPQKTATGERRDVLKGSTLDLANLQIHTSTLRAGQTNHPPRALNDREELIIVKEGQLKITTKDSSKILGPGGLALIVAGEEQSFSNPSKKPSTYYVIGFTAKAPVDIERGKQGGGSFIKDWSALEVRQTDKGESRPIFDRPSSMFRRFEVHATALNPGKASHAAHTHRAEEIILMIKGNGEMQIGETFHKAKAGDVILLGSMVPHAFTNTGSVQCGYFAIQWHH
jgi:(S)-ureidoglycine aminohydrolase